MSRTELQTHSSLDSLRHNNLSTHSISLHARSHRQTQEQDLTVLRESHASHGDVELAELTKKKNTPTSDTEEKASDMAVSENASSPSVRLVAFLQFASLCFTLFVAGWNDGTTGPLLPRMQTNYHVRIGIWTRRFSSLTPNSA